MVRLASIVFAVSGLASFLPVAAEAAPCPPRITIVDPGESTVLRYAAAELRSYAKRLFGQDWSIASRPTGEFQIRLASAPVADPSADPLAGTDSYQLLPVHGGLEIHGSNERSVLYGAYELVRLWGVRFHLSGDLLPEKASCALPAEPVRRSATLRIRGVHPYPDFLSGPSAWDAPEFEAYLRQLPKLGLNFFGIHQYTYEPYVDYEVDGVHPRQGELETSAMKAWGYGTVPACEFEIGRYLFDGCVWGSRTALSPRTPEERYAAAQALMAGAMKLANDLGLVTAFGFEPLAQDPEFEALAKTPEGLEKVVQARVDAIVKAFPALDYVWLFGDEGSQNENPRLGETFGLAARIERKLRARHPGKRVALGGWNVEDALLAVDRSDGISGEALLTSYGNYDPWRMAVWGKYQRFRQVKRPHAMAIWCEYDGRLLSGLQPNVTAYRALDGIFRDARSSGFFFLHWSTRLCDSNLEYLSRMSWEEKGEDPEIFYRDYFKSRLGLPDGAERDPVRAMMSLEAINRRLSLARMPFWLMSNDWDHGGNWRVAADGVQAVRKGTAIPESEAKYLRDQWEEAQAISGTLQELEPAIRALEAMVPKCRRDCGHAAYLASRARYFGEYLREYIRLSLGVRHILEAQAARAAGKDPEPHLRQLLALIDLERWRGILRLYLEHIDDRGEKGIVVSLNQKTLYGLKMLEGRLK